MPSTCQLDAHPGQNWNASHIAFNDGRNDGFVNGSGPVAMGYWDEHRHSLLLRARRRPSRVADRWFCSVLAQTYPNRRFLIAGTAAGIVSTTQRRARSRRRRRTARSSTGSTRTGSRGSTTTTTCRRRRRHPDGRGRRTRPTIAKASQFITDAAAGKLPRSRSSIPNFGHQSEENPQDIRQGERFAAAIINAAMHGPAWAKTLLIWTYDEHGGYYDHVPPPRAIQPDNIPPDIHVPPDLPGAYDRYGFRVPAVIVSPYARPQLRVARRARPHVGAEADRDEVEPPRAHLPRRERRQPPRLARLQVEAGVPRAADACPRPRCPPRSRSTRRGRDRPLHAGQPGRTDPAADAVVPRASRAAARRRDRASDVDQRASTARSDMGTLPTSTRPLQRRRWKPLRTSASSTSGAATASRRATRRARHRAGGGWHRPVVGDARARARRGRRRRPHERRLRAGRRAGRTVRSSVHDVAISRFGVMFFADPVAAFANRSRRLRPAAGSLVVWKPLAENEWFSEIGERTLASAAIDPSATPEPVRLGRPRLRAQRAGRRGVQPTWSSIRHDATTTPARCRRRVRPRAWLGLRRRLLGDLDDSTQARALDALRTMIAAHLSDGEITFDSACWPSPRSSLTTA